ncbi:hypothetical protein ANTRET_LOCUS8998 [Anthophora retusa]
MYPNAVKLQPLNTSLYRSHPCFQCSFSLIVACFVRSSFSSTDTFYNACPLFYSISLDPDEDIPDPELFTGLGTFLDNDLDATERNQILTNTIPRMVERAKALRLCKPPQGLHYSLQQQGNL